MNQSLENIIRSRILNKEQTEAVVQKIQKYVGSNNQEKLHKLLSDNFSPDHLGSATKEIMEFFIDCYPNNKSAYQEMFRLDFSQPKVIYSTTSLQDENLTSSEVNDYHDDTSKNGKKINLVIRNIHGDTHGDQIKKLDDSKEHRTRYEKEQEKNETYLENGQTKTVAKSNLIVKDCVIECKPLLTNSGVLYENFLDFNSEFKMSKITFNDQVMTNIIKNITSDQVQFLGILGDFEEAVRIGEKFIGKSLAKDISEHENLNKKDFEGIFIATHKNKIVLILKNDCAIFENFPADSTLNFVTYLRFMIDLCSKITIIPTKTLKFNIEKKSPFAKTINTEMEFQETMLIPTEKASLKAIPTPQTYNHEFHNNLLCVPDFNKNCYKYFMTSNIIRHKKEYFFKNNLIYDSYLKNPWGSEKLEINQLNIKLQKEWSKLDFFWTKVSKNEFTRRITGLLFQAFKNDKIEQATSVIDHYQNYFVEETIKLRKNTESQISKNVNDEFTALMKVIINADLNYSGKGKNENIFNMTNDHQEKNSISDPKTESLQKQLVQPKGKEDIERQNDFKSPKLNNGRPNPSYDKMKTKIIIPLHLINKLKKKYNFEEIEDKIWNQYDSSYTVTRNFYSDFLEALEQKSEAIILCKESIRRNLFDQEKNFRKKFINDFFEEISSMLEDTNTTYNELITIQLFTLNTIRDVSSQIECWNYSNSPVNIVIKLDFVSKKIVVVEQVIFIDENNAYIVICIRGSEKLIYHTNLLSRNEIKCSKLMTLQSSDAFLVTNPENKMWAIYDNFSQRFDIGKIVNGFKIDEGVIIDVYNKTIEGNTIQQIKSVVMLSQSDQIIFLNQDYKLFEYRHQSKIVNLLVKRENKGGEGISISQICPEGVDNFYREVQCSPDGKMIMLLSKTSLDIYDLSWTEVMKYNLKPDFSYFKVFTDKISNVLCIVNKGSIECFELTGIVASKVIKITDLNKTIAKINGNPIFDFIHHSFKKFGNQSSFLGCPEENDFYFFDQNSNYKKKVICDYFKLLKLENSNLEYVDDYESLKEMFDEIPFMQYKDLVSILISRVPIHLATIENYSLMPLQNGKSISQEINNLWSSESSSNLVKHINEIIKFGVYEKLISEQEKDVYVVSICGRQSSGKSYVMNRFFGTRFGVSSTRCTDGIWMSISKIKTEERDKFFVVLDCEGLFSARRTEKEETKMCLALSAISDIMILNQDLSFNRYLNQLFSNFAKGVGCLKSKHLFKGYLMMLIRDVTTSDSKGAYKELQSNLVQLERDKKNQFMAALFGGKIVSRCLNYFEQDIFADEIEDCRKERFLKLDPKRWTNGKDFLDSLKFTLAQIFVEDDSDMDSYRVKLKLETYLENFMKHFIDISEANVNHVKLLYSKEFKIDGQVFKIEISQNDIILSDNCGLSEGETSKLDTLVYEFMNNAGKKTESNHNEWIENLKMFIDSFLTHRKTLIMDLFDSLANFDAEFDESVSITRKKLKEYIDDIISDSKYCNKKCRNCNRLCFLNCKHEKDCDCDTSHLCGLVCDIGKDCVENKFKCIEIYGHENQHRCAEGKHKCGEQCSINDCLFTCSLEKGHSSSKKHDCHNKHACIQKCRVINCTRKCQYDRTYDHGDLHDCGENKCSKSCTLCEKTCSFPNHFHDDLIKNEENEKLEEIIDGKNILKNYHCCSNSHSCTKNCDMEGVCQVGFTAKEAVWENSFSKFTYIQYIPKESRLPCKITFKDTLGHTEKHQCILTTPHRCPEQCPECLSFCNKDFGHAGRHFTNLHRNKKHNVILSRTKEEVVSYEENGTVRTFEVGESCEPESCSSSCARRGRAHFHLKECKGGNECSAKINSNVRHSNEKFSPFTDKTFDFWLCKNFWNSQNWDLPVEGEHVNTIPLCSHVCASNTHVTENSFCNLNAWHDGDHNFTCTHPTLDFSNVDVVFVCDTTASMQAYIQNSKNTIKRIMADFAKKFKEFGGLKIAFVAYQDHYESLYLTKYQDFTTELNIINFIASLSASGGGDGPEAVLDGLNDAVTKLTWRTDSVKYLFHICDAPSHGKEYTTGYDKYPDGCPCNLTIEDIAVRLRNKNIKFKMLKIGDYPNIMANKFKSVITDFELSDLNHALKLEDIVSGILTRDMQANDLDFKKG